MDPISLTAAVLSCVTNAARAGMALHELRIKWREAPSVLALMSSECRAMRSALERLENHLATATSEDDQLMTGPGESSSMPAEFVREEVEAAEVTLKELSELCDKVLEEWKARGD